MSLSRRPTTSDHCGCFLRVIARWASASAASLSDRFLIKVSAFRSDSGFAVVSWAYGHTAHFSYLAVSCLYTPWSLAF